MKRVTLLFALAVCLTLGAQAQEYKKFKVGMGFGYTIPSDGGGGIALYFEPAYRVSDQIAIGLRIESAAMAKNVGGETSSVSGTASYTLNGQYYLSNNKFRPFVGLGFGLYSNASISVDGFADLDPSPSFGFYPRIGFDLGHFNVTLDYNIVPATKEVEIGGTSDEIKNSYIGIKLGFSISGGNN